MLYHHIYDHFFKADYIAYNFTQLIIDNLYKLINNDEYQVKVIAITVN